MGWGGWSGERRGRPIKKTSRKQEQKTGEKIHSINILEALFFVLFFFFFFSKKFKKQKQLVMG